MTGGVGALAIMGEGVVISAGVVLAFEVEVTVGSLGQAMVTCG
jgi:hypothetical protein